MVDELVEEVVGVLVVVDVVRWVVVPRVVVEVEVVVGVVVVVDVVVVELGAVDVGVVGAGAVEVVGAGEVEVVGVVAVVATLVTVAVAVAPRLVLVDALRFGAQEPLTVAVPRLTAPDSCPGLSLPAVHESADAADVAGRASAAAAVIPRARARACLWITAVGPPGTTPRGRTRCRGTGASTYRPEATGDSGGLQFGAVAGTRLVHISRST